MQVGFHDCAQGLLSSCCKKKVYERHKTVLKIRHLVRKFDNLCEGMYYKITNLTENVHSISLNVIITCIMYHDLGGVSGQHNFCHRVLYMVDLTSGCVMLTFATPAGPGSRTVCTSNVVDARSPVQG